jgi:hypothetical protein
MARNVIEGDIEFYSDAAADHCREVSYGDNPRSRGKALARVRGCQHRTWSK